MHVGATLVYIGSRSKFCLVQCVSIENDGSDLHHKDEDDSADDVRLAGRRCMYRLTTFSLRHDEHGELTTGKSREVQYYKVPKATTKLFLVEDPVAFWM